MTTKTMTAPAEGKLKIGPKIKTALPGPNAKRVLDGDEQYISPSYTRSYPLVAKSGRGIVVTDVDGNEFFDFSAGIAVTSTGHCHPDVVAAIQKQAAELIHMSGTDFYYESMVHTRRTPLENRSHARPAQDLLWQLRRRSHRVRAEARPLPHQAAEHDCLLRRVSRTHHGRALAHRLKAATEASFRASGARRNPYSVIPISIADAKTRPQDPDAFALGCARFIEEKLFKTTLAPEEVAAIFVEPVQGEGGYVIAPTIFMQELRRICDRTAFCWSSMKCRAALPALANGGPSSTPAWNPTSSASPKALPPACR